MNGKTESSGNRLQWSAPGTGQYRFDVAATDNSGKTDERSWNIIIASEKDLVSKACEQMRLAYEKLDVNAMRSLVTERAYPEVDLLINTMKRSNISGLRIQYGEPTIQGQQATVTAKMLQWYHYRDGWQDYPQEVIKTHTLRNVDGNWKFESLQLK